MQLAGVAGTAVSAARVRAMESARPDALFHDPYAAAFAALQPQVDEGPASAERRALAFHVVIRTPFYDDFLLRAGCPQVVVLGAGLDTRAFRLAVPAQTRWFEVDRAEVFAVKDAVLTDVDPACSRTTVAADLTGDWSSSLQAAAFDPSVPTAWLIEGVFAYLSSTQAAHVLARVDAASAVGSAVAFEKPHGRRRLAAADVQATAGLWQEGLAPAELDRLRSSGWSIREHLLSEVAASYGRPVRRASDSAFLMARRVST
ncbi:MAG TPA: SAM-dependent methyltransferase [Mycobacteriales bacterium]|nr:SAM-dependent methyltransferase [Mycobacteriales bacterium]